MAEFSFLDWAIDLLEQIENSQEKKAWCYHYSVYSSNPGQEDLFHDLNVFVDRAYEKGLVISNYQEVLRRWQFEERSIADADPEQLRRIGSHAAGKASGTDLGELLFGQAGFSRTTDSAGTVVVPGNDRRNDVSRFGAAGADEHPLSESGSWSG